LRKELGEDDFVDKHEAKASALDELEGYFKKRRWNTDPQTLITENDEFHKMDEAAQDKVLDEFNKAWEGLIKTSSFLSNGTKTSGGTPIRMTDANKVVAHVNAGWAKTLQRPHLAPTFSSLSPDVQQAIRDEGGDHTTQGVYHNGVIHIILDESHN
jgi:hypothetical protein